MWEAICGLVGAIIGAGLTGWSSLALAKKASNDREAEGREKKIQEALEFGIQIRIRGRDVIVFLQDTLHAMSYGKEIDEQAFQDRLATLTQKSYEAQANASRAFIHVGSGALTFNNLAIAAGRELGRYIHRLQETQRGNLPMPSLSIQLGHPVQQPDVVAVTAMIEDADKARVYLNETYLLTLKNAGIYVRNLPLAPRGHRELPNSPQDT